MSDNIYFNILTGWTIQKRKTSNLLIPSIRITVVSDIDNYPRYPFYFSKKIHTSLQEKLIIPGAGHCEAEVVDPK
ncbi:hypothetical protein [Peribacillus phoenicis]|uniref:hypothetical protein n=1 Tax=Peribacillus sp. 1P06PA-2 TaxID=3132295 RepID=UPI0039A6C1B7